jgi:CBS domain-containing protein/predicted transcriptional regulator
VQKRRKTVPKRHSKAPKVDKKRERMRKHLMDAVEERQEEDDAKVNSVPVSMALSKKYVIFPQTAVIISIMESMKERKDYCVILSQGNSVVGVLDGSVLPKYADPKKAKDAETVAAKDVMSKPASIYENDMMSEALKKMKEKKVDSLLVLDRRNKFIGVVFKNEIISRFAFRPDSKIETKIDVLLEMLEKKGSMHFDEVCKKLNIDSRLAEEWGNILEEHGLIKIDYPPFGRPIYKIMQKQTKLEEEKVA